MFSKFKAYLPWLIVAVAIIAALWAWYHPKTINVSGDTQYQEVKVPKPYAVISKQTVTVEVIKVITKTEIKEKWPDWFTGDPNQQLTAIGLIEPYRGKTECASVINLATGDSRIVSKRLPIPLFGFGNTKRIGAIVGNGVAVNAEWSFLRVGNFYTSLGGTFASTAGQTVAVGGIGIKYEW